MSYIRSSSTEVVKLTCDVGGNWFRENDRQRGVTSTTTIYYKLQLLQMRAPSRQTNKSPGGGWVKHSDLTRARRPSKRVVSH